MIVQENRTVYVTSDGFEFIDPNQARIHENRKQLEKDLNKLFLNFEGPGDAPSVIKAILDNGPEIYKLLLTCMTADTVSSIAGSERTIDPQAGSGGRKSKKEAKKTS
jgi:hypothetical protein